MLQTPRRRPLILAVDDDPSVLDALHLLLDDRYELLGAQDAETALALIQSRPVTLILLDLLMEGTDGIGLLERLRGAKIDTPVIVISGLNNVWTAATAMRLGAVDYILKPFDEDELEAVIDATLRRDAEAAALRPDREMPRILLIGCAIGRAASLTVALSGHAHVESIPAGGDALTLIPPVSPDAIVVDLGGGALVETLAKVRARFQLAPIIAITPARRSTLSSELAAEGITVLAKPVGLRELLEAIAMELRPSVATLPRFSPRVIRIIDSVGDNLAAATLQGLGATLRTSPYHLSRLFRAETGMSLRVYLHRVRVQAARQLLLETTDKLETVAARVGLYSGSHLSRLFLKYAGQRPGDFRRTCLQSLTRA